MILDERPLNDRTLLAEDGTRIAYGVAGNGPALVLTNGLTTTTNFWARLWPIWKERFTVITWDYPGHGASEPSQSAEGASIEAQARTLARVMDAAGSPQAAQVGFSIGCQVVLELYRQAPERCSAIAALLGTSEHAISSTGLWLRASVVARLFEQSPKALFGPGFHALGLFANTRIGLSLGRKLRLVGTASAHDMRGVTKHFLQLDAATMRSLALSAEAHSAFDVLPTIDVPFLIVAGDKDPFAPVERVGLAMHRAAPRSQLLRLPEGTHTAMLDHVQEIADAVEGLLGSSRSVVAA
jgi:pimeloyl-ACP methyl ester carboxylesterase